MLNIHAAAAPTAVETAWADDAENHVINGLVDRDFSAPAPNRLWESSCWPRWQQCAPRCQRRA